ncbi:MAG: Nicotinate dehydrogenase small FeS subunit [Elusimicrobia bacterium ADurb.Bin231]|nr:MAG: Nicotinate dehydrogenase small FeS subunit [Elusimicrobia bacterium ADurb.Bin231]
MAQKISITVNGIKRTVEIDGWEKLVDVLRDKLGLTGTKKGCDDLSCGACTVIVDGEAKKSCSMPAIKADGTTILTIEGLSKGKTIHPIQKALIEAGAVQCGYCTPGIVLELYALFTKNIDATQEEITNALAKHLCRCTGYEAIFEGAILAQRYMKGNK